MESWNYAAGLAAMMLCAPAMAEPVSDPVASDAQVADIIVNGRAQHLYRVDTTTVGKSAEDPLDIPQALQVINEELFTDQGARDATDIYRNISGVSAFSYAGITFAGFGKTSPSMTVSAAIRSSAFQCRSCSPSAGSRC